MAGNLFEVDKQCNAIVERSDIWVGAAASCTLWIFQKQGKEGQCSSSAAQRMD